MEEKNKKSYNFNKANNRGIQKYFQSQATFPFFIKFGKSIYHIITKILIFLSLSKISLRIINYGGGNL